MKNWRLLSLIVATMFLCAPDLHAQIRLGKYGGIRIGGFARRPTFGRVGAVRMVQQSFRNQMKLQAAQNQAQQKLLAQQQEAQRIAAEKKQRQRQAAADAARAAKERERERARERAKEGTKKPASAPKKTEPAPDTGSTKTTA